MIDSIEFENYRAFKTSQCLQLKPITVIFGKNNSGKTALLKLPVLLETSLNGNINEVFASETSSGLKICTEMRDVVFGKSNKSVHFRVSDSKKNIFLDYNFYVDITSKIQTHIERYRIEENDRSIFSFEDEDLKTSLIDFKGAILVTDNKISQLDSLKFKTDYIGSVRTAPEIDIRLISDSPDYSGTNGYNCYQYLINESLKTNSDFVEKVSAWYEKNFDGWRISVNKRIAPIYHIEMISKDFAVNILDTGFGIIQSMPIVIRATRKCTEPTLVILEEPETHLHPAAHASLGELIAMSAIDDKNKKYLIETHSFNFLLRLRRLIAEKRLSADDVAFYYVNFDKETCSSKLNQIKIDSNGLIDESTPWPEGIFEESLQEVIGIRDANS